MCRNLSCQNDRHISSYRHQNRELRVTKSGAMAAVFFSQKKVAMAFPGGKFRDEKDSQGARRKNSTHTLPAMVTDGANFGSPVVFKVVPRS